MERSGPMTVGAVNYEKDDPLDVVRSNDARNGVEV